MPILDVGGSSFPTSWETLRAVDCFFRALTEDYTFIDRDPTHFRYILNYMRGTVVLPSDRTVLDEIRVEADFYSIRGLVDAIDLLLEKRETSASMADLVAAVRGVARALVNSA